MNSTHSPTNTHEHYQEDWETEFGASLKAVPCPSERIERWRSRLMNEASKDVGTVAVPQRLDVVPAIGTSIETAAVLEPATKFHRRNAIGKVAILASLAAALIAMIGYAIYLMRSPTDHQLIARANSIFNNSLEPASFELRKLTWLERLFNQLQLADFDRIETLCSKDKSRSQQVIRVVTKRGEMYITAFAIQRPTQYSEALRAVPSSSEWFMAAMERDGMLIVVASKNDLRQWLLPNAFT